MDSSAWIEYLRGTGSAACDEVGRLLLADDREVVLVAPVVMELLAGAPDERALRALERLTNALRTLPLDPDQDFHLAAAASRTVRAGGATARSLIDCLIAVLAARHGAVLVHRDADLEALRRALPGLRTLDLRDP